MESPYTRSLGIIAAVLACSVPTETGGQREGALALPVAALSAATFSGSPVTAVAADGPSLTATFPDTLPVGAAVRVPVEVRDAAGRKLPPGQVRLALVPHDTAVVAASKLTLTARRAGRTGVTAVWHRDDGLQLYVIDTVVVVDTSAAPPDSTSNAPDSTSNAPDSTSNPGGAVPPPPGSDVPRKRGRPDLRLRVAVTRWDGATRGAVATGIPLPPGYLLPEDTAHVRLRLAGAPQRIHVAALPATHPDGTLRAVLVSGVLAVDVGELAVTDTLRPEAERLPASEAPAPQGVPAGALLPSDPAYLVTTLLVGPTITATASRAQGAPFDRYERDLLAYGEERWTKDGDDRGHNYYDRALAWYAAWARTGDATWWYRAARMAVRYRVDYLEFNSYSSSPHYAQLEGLQLHWLLTGDEASRVAVSRTAEMLYRSVQLRDGFGNPATQKGENRQLARALQGELLAWRVAAPYGKLADPVGAARAMVDAALALQAPDGAWRFPDLCGQGLNYMDGMLAEQLIEYHRLVTPDPRILPALLRHAEWQWTTQWLAGAQAFQYATGYCEGVGGTGAAEDVLGLQVNEYAWLYAQTGDARWRDRALAILTGMGRVWLDGTKQYNQTFALSYRALSYLGAR